MRIISVLLVLALCVVALGFYRGWFSMSSRPHDAQSNKIDVGLTVDPDRMKEDTRMVRDKTTELSDKAATEAKELRDQVRDNVDPDD